MKGRIRTIAMFVVVSVALAPYTWIQSTPALAQAIQVAKFNETLTLPGVPLANPCQIGDIILLSGDIHVTGQILVTGNGRVQVRAHINTSNLSGESLTTGTKYQLNAV